MKPASIMIVENNTALRNILRHAFENRGYITWTCPAPEIAISIFSAIQPSIVILDLDFEGFNSLPLIDAWRVLSPETRVIVESTCTDDTRMQEAIVHGAHACLAKPFDLLPLFELLERDFPHGPFSAAPFSQAA
jgi:DNA-binding NtrC family response regulator